MPNTIPVPHERVVRPVLLFFIGITVTLLIGQTWWAIEQDRHLTIASEKRNSLTTVRSLEDHATRVLTEADHLIASSVDALQSMDDATLADQQALHQLLLKEIGEFENISALWIVNLDGVNWISTLRYPVREADFKNHPNIQFLNARPQHEKMVIGLPVQNDDDNQWTMPLVRNLYDRNNRRIGIIGASIPVSYFEDFYKRVTKGKNTSVTLRTNNGFVLMRSPFDEKKLGTNVSDTLLNQRIDNGASEGSFEGHSAFDGQLRLFSYSKTLAYPITTIYGEDIQSVLALWRDRSVDRMLFTGAAILFICILTFFLLLHMRRWRKSEYLLKASENRYRMLYESAPEGIFLISKAQKYIDCNSAAVKLLGVSDKRHIIGKELGDFFSAEQALMPSSHADRQRLIDAALTGSPQQFEWAIPKDGQHYFNEITLSGVEMENGPMILAIFRDINDRKQSEQLQQDQNRILHFIASGHDLQKILEEVIFFIERRAPHSHCMILLANEDRSLFTWGAGPNIPEKILQAMIELPIAEGNGVSSEAVLTQYPVMVEDIGTHSSMRETSDLFTSSGFVGCGCWPIMGKRGQILGAFSMLYREHHIPSAEDVQLVGISTDLAGIAVESRRAEERILHLAHYDELTGLPNRFLYIQHLNKALAQAERTQIPIGVLFLDLDRFKSINDTFGHETGDAVLRDVAAKFRTCLRDSDTIARVGGDEFIILVDDYIDPHQLGEVAQRLLVEAAKPFDIQGEECQLSASVGIATYPVDGMNAQVLLKNADIAMYRAKATGRNNYQFYSSEMNTHTVERLALETRMRRAIERREFVMHYQPKMDVRTGEIVGAEALVRWHHPERGILMPGVFIGLAEEAGLIGLLGKLVLESTCRDITTFRKAGISFGRVAINLSASQFNDANLLDDVKSITNSCQIDPGCIEFEITESMVMHNRDQAIHLMDEIRRLGFSLSIDDFGTGYSSLAYLKRFPVNSIKVDKSFINDIPQDPNDSAIVKAIIVMAHTIGLQVVAEGVETFSQLKTLQKFGCDEYQGNYISTAISDKDFIAFVKQHNMAMPTI